MQDNFWLVGLVFFLDEYVFIQDVYELQNLDEDKEVRVEVVVLKISMMDLFYDQFGIYWFSRFFNWRKFVEIIVYL